MRGVGERAVQARHVLSLYRRPSSAHPRYPLSRRVLLSRRFVVGPRPLACVAPVLLEPALFGLAASLPHGAAATQAWVRARVPLFLALALALTPTLALTLSLLRR